MSTMAYAWCDNFCMNFYSKISGSPRVLDNLESDRLNVTYNEPNVNVGMLKYKSLIQISNPLYCNFT